MAFGIRVFEKDEYLFALLRQRLGYYFPEAYIMRFTRPDVPAGSGDESERFCEFEKTLFDQRQFKTEDTGDPDAICLFSDKGIIDCQSLSRALGISSKVTPVNMSDKPGSKITVLLSFVYREERERYISTLKDPYEYDVPLRLDFTGGYGIGNKESENMNDLLRLSRSRKFKGDDILSYVHRDSTGYLTPGGTADPDICHDIGAAGVTRILNAASELATSDSMSLSVLAVLDSFSSKDMLSISGSADRVIVLIHTLSPGLQDFISRLNRSLPHDVTAEVILTSERTAEYGKNAV